MSQRLRISLVVDHPPFNDRFQFDIVLIANFFEKKGAPEISKVGLKRKEKGDGEWNRELNHLRGGYARTIVRRGSRDNDR